MGPGRAWPFIFIPCVSPRVFCHNVPLAAPTVKNIDDEAPHLSHSHVQVANLKMAEASTKAPLPLAMARSRAADHVAQHACWMDGWRLTVLITQTKDQAAFGSIQSSFEHAVLGVYQVPHYHATALCMSRRVKMLCCHMPLQLKSKVSPAWAHAVQDGSATSTKARTQK